MSPSLSGRSSRRCFQKLAMSRVTCRVAASASMPVKYKSGLADLSVLPSCHLSSRPFQRRLLNNTNTQYDWYLNISQSTMSTDRAGWRNVHFYNALTGDCLGGFYQRGSLTEESLIGILTNVLLIVKQPLTVKHRESDRLVTPSQNLVELGHYDISSTGLSFHIHNPQWPVTRLIYLGPIHLNDEPWVARLITYSLSGRPDEFRNGVRHRDRKCVITGQVNNLAPWNRWPGMHAAHVFPLEYENIWREHNYGRWITNMDDAVGISKINSTQNGLLMNSQCHSFFDQYLFSINPDVSL